MDKVSKRVVERSAWAASAALAPVNLPREGLITEVGVRANITITFAATGLTDATKRIIQSLKIEGDGRTFLGLGGEQMGRVLNFMNECDFGCTLLHAPVDVGTTSFNQSFVFHPGSNPKDPFDMSAVIPARALANLKIGVTTPADSVCDSVATISAGYYYYWVNHVLEMKVPPGIMTPMGSTFFWPHDQAYSDFTKEINVPTGAYLRRIVILEQCVTTQNRIDDQLTGLRLKLPKAASHPIELLGEDLKTQTAKRYGVEGWMQDQILGLAADTRPGYNGAKVMPVGLYILDLRDYFHPQWGANLIGYEVGDVKLGLTIESYNAGDDTIIYWDQVKPVDPEYVGK